MNFIKSFLENPSSVGAVAESSQGLAEEIVKHFPAQPGRKPVRVLEIGSGTGVFTRHLLTKLGPDDTLDIVELDAKFYELLLTEFGDDPRVSVHWEDITKFEPAYKFNFIVSGLPLNSFESGLVRAITNKYVDLAGPDAILSFFEYTTLAGLRSLTGLFVDDRHDYQKVRVMIEDLIANFKFDEGFVLGNIPPANVYHLRMPKYTTDA